MRFWGAVLLWSGLLVSCGDGGSGETFGGHPYKVVDAGDLVRSDASLTGSGSLVFTNPLSEIASKNSFRLTFTLQDGGSLSLVSNASDALTGGVSVRFTRTGTTLGVTLRTDSASQDVSVAFAAVDASTALTFQIDLHNDETPAHILIWDSTVTSFTEGNATLNSEDPGLEAPGNGTGTFWGLVLSKAGVTGAALSGAKFTE